jgi:hypothetical protein
LRQLLSRSIARHPAASSASFIGLQWSNQQFSTGHPVLFDKERREQSTQYYNTVQLWGRYSICPRVQLFAFIPLRSSLYIAEGAQRLTEAGIGDASLLANIVLLRENGFDTAVQHSLIAGAGIKAPTGRYSGVRDADRQGVPNLQPGTGSTDFLLNANYSLRKGRNGLNADASYTITTANAIGYRYGNRLNAGLMYFHTIREGSWQLLPQMGLRTEWGARDYSDWKRGWVNDASGGAVLFAAAGMQAYRGRTGFRLLGQLPVAQHITNGYVQAHLRIDAGIFLLF